MPRPARGSMSGPSRPRSGSRRANEVQLVPFMEEMAVFVISDWGGVGDGSQELPCLDEHKAEFGRSHAFNLMPWLLSEAEDLDQYIADEKASAKNG